MSSYEQQVGEIIDSIVLRTTQSSRPDASELAPRGNWTLETVCDVVTDAVSGGLVEGANVDCFDGPGWLDLRVTAKGHAFHEAYMEQRAITQVPGYPIFLFTSYCNPYQKTAKKVANFFRHNLRLPSEQIRCTATPVHGLQNGVEWKRVLLEEVEKSRNALFLASQSMQFSAIMTEEFKTRIASNRKPDFLVLPNNPYTTLHESVSVYHAPPLDMDGLMGLLRTYAKQLGVTIDEMAATSEAIEIAAPRAPFADVLLHYEALLSDGRREAVPLWLSPDKVLPLILNGHTEKVIRPRLNKLCSHEYAKLGRGPAQDGSSIVDWSLTAFLEQSGVR